MEIYNTTWWGNAIDTAITAGTEPDFFGSQMKMLTSQQPEEVINGDFDTDSDWVKEAGWTISGGKANCLNGQGVSIYQTNIVDIGKQYKLTFTISNYSQGFLGSLGNDFGGVVADTNGSYEIFGTATSTTFGFSAFGNFIGSIDNVSIKLARAEEVEAVKCLADWIHTTALQDLNN